MIIIFHENNRVLQVWNFSKALHVDVKTDLPSKALFEVAFLYPEKLIVWCDGSQKENLNIAIFPELFHHQKIMASYAVGEHNYFPNAIGYVDQSPFIKINKSASYPTWQMSSNVGGIHASALNAMKKDLNVDSDFDYFLNSMAKQAMQRGLLCYSEPKLVSNKSENSRRKSANSYHLFKFVKQHYKTRWIFLLLLNFILHEKKFPILPFVYCLIFKKRRLRQKQFENILVCSTKEMALAKTIDVLIPTIGRKLYLYDVLCDLRAQTHLPKKIIIVEQNPVESSSSELDYITSEEWPFEIKLIFTQQTGACNARNLALAEIQSDWVFLADDDIRIDKNFIESGFNQVYRYKISACSFACEKSNKKIPLQDALQTTLFSSGCSFVSKKAAKDCKFNEAFEFGFGEDSDFGMQLRNNGNDVVYFHTPSAIHLKAPVGGFRIKPSFLWDEEMVQPKPSPTVLLFKLLHFSNHQVRGFKTNSFFKFYKFQRKKNPFSYYRNFQVAWEKSLYWANKLRS